MKDLVLIDGNSLLNRAYFAMQPFSTQSGMPTNAIFGFVRLLLKILDDYKPDYIAVAFDLKAPTFRHKMYSGYKATRKPMAEDLAAQVEPLKNLLSAMKIATCGIEGIEADDVLGTLSKKFNVHSYIFTGDRDCFQLVDEKTEVCFTKKGVSEIQRLSLKNFKEEVGFEPLKIIDYKALRGDSSDNIPGVPGVGEKTAMELITRYGDLRGIYEHLNELKPSLKEKLESNKESAELSFTLAKINRDCQIDLELEDCVAPKKFGSEVKAIFAELEFKSLLGLDIFYGESAEDKRRFEYPDVVECASPEDLNEALASNELAAVLDADKLELYDGKKLYKISVKQDLFAQLNGDSFTEILKSVFCDGKKRVITYDFKRVLHLLDEIGLSVECEFEDLELARYLCESNLSNSSLKELCDVNLYDYGYRGFAVFELFKEYNKRLNDEELYKLYSEIEKPLVKVLFEMEKQGVKVSRDVLNELKRHFNALTEEYKKRIFEGCGCEFNVNSPSQLAEVLYTKLGLTEVKKRSGKYSTSAEVLEKLVDKAPVVGDVLKYRQYQKLLSTYCDGLLPLIDGNDLVHTTFNQNLTTTGRLSSSNPNLQNIPIREDEGKELRKMFVPHDGCVFIDADYSQIELRLLAHFSGCKELIKAYNDGVDVHAVTASQVFKVDINEVTPQMRREAKAVNFGIIYGISDFGLSKNLNIPVKTAREYIERYFETYSAVKDYMNSNVEFAREHGYVCTLTGRKRIIPEIKASNYMLRQFGERAAMNMPLQGSSADIIKIAMVNVYNELKRQNLKTRIILQVHDELVLEAPENEERAASEILKSRMENAVKLNVPLTIELHVGKNWYDAK